MIKSDISNPFSAQVVAELLEKLRQTTPRVHCITNAVAQELTANVLLATGALPSMTIAPEEVEAFAASADALLVNLGTLDDVRRAAIPKALQGARAAGRPVVLDPVFIERSPVRCAYARALLSDAELRPDIVKANAGEVACLPELADLVEAGWLVLATTGATDRVSAGRHVVPSPIHLSNGTELLGRVTATGCALGALIGAFVSVADNPDIGAAAAISVFNIAAERAAEHAGGPGTLMPALLDELYALQPKHIELRLKFSLQTSMENRQETVI
ncbi:hydroxyethylthiazole kinase [Roseibium sp.]|uniref:hydroxyethylthiazole kinase n=1 Tax=Roseibium sp. TaxID=1936156 RepID=UPI003A979168